MVIPHVFWWNHPISGSRTLRYRPGSSWRPWWAPFRTSLAGPAAYLPPVPWLPCDFGDCDWYGDLHGADATCNNHRPSTATQNHNPCWYSWSDSDIFWLPTFSSSCESCQRSEQMTPGTLVASHPSSSWIKMVLPPSWDHHFKMSRVAPMFTNPWNWNHPFLCWSPRYPSCIQLQQLCLRSGEPQGITLLDGPYRQDQSLPRMLTMKIFSRPTEPYI